MEVNRNKDASARGESTSTSKPVGMTYDNGSSTFREGSEDAQQFFNVIGEGGSTRHTGYFSSNNPYFNQLGVASNNQDKDALYELSVQWEADYANRQMQLDENRAILEEQRAYDSPLAQVQRQREAGINPDLAAAGSGSGASSGSSAQLTNPGMADQTGQTKFSNAYDNANLVFAGINTAANFIGTLSNVATSVVDSVCKLNLLDPQRNLVSAQAGLVNAQAGEINTLLAGKKTSQDISNSSAYLQQLASVAQLTSADTTDENMTPFLRGIGLTEEQLPDALNIVRQMHSNPAALAKFFGDINDMRANKARSQVYTQEVTNQLTNVAYKLQAQQLAGDLHLQNIKTTVAELLDEGGYISCVAQQASNQVQLGLQQTDLGFDMVKNQSKSLEVQREQLKLGLQSAKRDYDAFTYALIQRQYEVSLLKKRENAIYKKYMSDGEITSVEQAVLDGIHAEIVSLKSMNASQMYQLHQHLLSSAYKYMSSVQFVNDEGNLRNTDSWRKSFSDFAGYNFSSILLNGPTFEQMEFDREKLNLEYDKYFQSWVNMFIPNVVFPIPL